jgi:acetolactate synthase-1/3 small subunit
MTTATRTIAVEVENKPGELARIVNLFAARGVNIESLAVDTVGDGSVSACRVVIEGDARIADQLVRLLDKQVRVLSARECPASQTEEKTA